MEAGELWREAPVSLRGQTALGAEFSAALGALVQRPDVHLVLESGTWFGGGAAWTIAQALRSVLSNAAQPDRWLMTLESFAPAHAYAVQTLARLPATCFLGGTVGAGGFISEAAAAEAAGLEAEVNGASASLQHLRYYAHEKELAADGPVLLPALCAAYDFDLVLLDGNEYTGRAEFDVVEGLCRPHFVVLHDCGTLKTRAVEAHLNEHPLEWRLLSSGRSAAVAWAAYESLSWRGPPEPLRILSTDYHIGPIADVKHFLAIAFPDAATVTDLSLSGACASKGTCATAGQLSVLKAGDVAGIYATSQLQRQLFAAYAEGGLPFEHDLFHCSHPTGMCELFM